MLVNFLKGIIPPAFTKPAPSVEPSPEESLERGKLAGLITVGPCFVGLRRRDPRLGEHLLVEDDLM